MSTGTVLLPTLPSPAPLDEAVLFACDDVALPFRSGVEMRLNPVEPMRNAEIVLSHGPEGSHDEVLLYYGSIARVGETLHLWYVGNHGAFDNDVNLERTECVICYATSTDGVNWEKPSLGLVEFKGSRDNNIVALDEPGLWSTCAVLHDPDEPDPGRRFKIAYEARLPERPGLSFCIAYSPDGLTWTRHPANPVGPFLEMSGITRFRDMYYVNGQTVDSTPHPFVRRLWTFASSDFVHWSPAGAIGLDRSPDLAGPSVGADLHQFEEIHLGAALWNRGNVLVGIYGQWHGHPSGDRRMTVIDLGLALSHDAIHFREPIPSFRLIPAREQPGSPAADYWPALQQGQGMENIGDRTLYWYSLWRGTEGSGIRMVWWERDRLSSLRPHDPAARVVSAPFAVESGAIEVFLNASGLGAESKVRVSLLDEGFHPLAGRTAVVGEAGLRVPVGLGALRPDDGRLRVELSVDGLRPEDVHVHALYLSGLAGT
jgi:hypothetical protein